MENDYYGHEFILSSLFHACTVLSSEIQIIFSPGTEGLQYFFCMSFLLSVAGFLKSSV